jgi:TM2 domain-containing membrane protein YozV
MRELVRDSDMKDKTTAAILAIFFGGLGIHKFYLRRPVWGLLYLVFSWTFVPVMVGFVEGVVLLFMSQASFDAKFNPNPGLAGAGAGSAGAFARPGLDRVETLQALQQLRASGALTEDEFQREKKMLLVPGRASGATSAPSIEERVLGAARRLQGQVTPVSVAADGGITVEQARQELERLAKENACLMDVSSDGLVVFRFPEFEAPRTKPSA